MTSRTSWYSDSMPSDRHLLLPKAMRRYTRPLGLRMRDLAYASRNLFCRVHPHPVFILGHQKSGTSAIAALLAQACDLDVTIDLLREVWWPTYQRVLARHGDTFDGFIRRNRLGFSRAVVKEPNLTLFVPELRAAFPRSSMVMVVRDPRDVTRSLLNAVSLAGDLGATDAGSELTTNPGWGLVLDSSWLGLEGEHYIDRISHRWNFFADVYLDETSRFHLVRYEDFVRDKVGEVRRLAALLGREATVDISDKVDVQFQPAGDRGRTWTHFFGAANLARIESICHDRMLRLGYEPSSRSDGA